MPEDTLSAHQVLIEAGRTIATLAEPDKDLLQFGNDAREIATTLQMLGDGLDNALANADERRENRYELLSTNALWHIAEQREWTRDEIELAYRNEIMSARRQASRTLKKVLVDTAKLIGEIEGAAR